MRAESDLVDDKMTQNMNKQRSRKQWQVERQ